MSIIDKPRPCPWDTVPLTIEEAVKSLEKLEQWETKNKMECPSNWKPVITTKLMLDLLQRLQLIEDQVYDAYDQHNQISNGDAYSSNYGDSNAWDPFTL